MIKQNNKKIYILTFQRVLNNGGALQCYALSKFLTNSGYDVKVIDYLPLYFLWQIYRPAKGFKKTIKKIKKILSFRDFLKNIPLTKKIFFFKKQLRKKYFTSDDIFIVGSDQIWNKRLTGNRNDLVFFLSIISNKGTKLAYAASSGGNHYFDSTIYSSLHNFKKIGVRENTLKSFLDIKGINSDIVCDPSLLIQDYNDVFSQNNLPEKSYLLTYCVGSDETENNFKKLVNEIKKTTKLHWIHIGANFVTGADQNIIDLGPAEWLSFFKNADVIATNSFHGTAFSINFNKQFLFLPHLVEGLNDRQQTLLQRVNLQERFVTTFDEVHRCLENQIDYKSVNKSLTKYIENSQKFLINAIIQSS